MLFLLSCVQGAQEFVLTDDHNYAFSSSLSASSVAIAEGEDGIVDWSALQKDMLGNVMEPSDIDALSIIRFPRLSQTEVLLGINNETLKQSDLSGFVDFTPTGGAQMANISAFSLQGTSVDPATELLSDQGTFLVFAERAEEVASLLFFEPDVESQNHHIPFENESVILEYEIALQEGVSLSLEAAREYYLDWSGLTMTGSGNPISLEQIDRVIIGGFSMSLSELESDFLRLEQLAEQLYELEVAGETAIPLDRFTGFAGFDEELQWIVALQCSRCLNPAPFFVGIFE